MNLSKIKYTDLFFRFSKKDIEKIVFSKDNYDSKITFDVALVFGGVSMIPHRLDKAIELYKQKKIKKILVSGGIGFLSLNRHNKEALMMRDYLLECGISREDIIIEEKSRNTNENIQNSLKIINDMYDMNDINILLITSDFHLKRCTKLIKNLSKSEKIYGVGIKDGKNDLNNWTEAFSSKKNIYVEAILLLYYAKHHKLEGE